MTSKANWQVLFAEDDFCRRNHLWRNFSLQRAAFRSRKSSLGELFTAEGCISQKEIIPERAFLCRGMHFAEGNHLWESFFLQRMTFAEGNHPWESFSLQRDAFCGRKSSLGELFPAEGCISRKKIISVVNFLCGGMIITEGNHPWESFFLQRDDYCRRKSSLRELFSAAGCILRKEIIPAGAFFCRGMIIAEGNHPWESFFLQRDALPHRIVIPDKAFS